MRTIYLFLALSVSMFSLPVWADCYSSITIPQAVSDGVKDRCWFNYSIRTNNGAISQDTYDYWESLYCATCTAIGPTLGIAAIAVPFEYFPKKFGQQKRVMSDCESKFSELLGAACSDITIIDAKNRKRMTLDQYYQPTEPNPQSTR